MYHIGSVASLDTVSKKSGYNDAAARRPKVSPQLLTFFSPPLCYRQVIGQIIALPYLLGIDPNRASFCSLAEIKAEEQSLSGSAGLALQSQKGVRQKRLKGWGFASFARFDLNRQFDALPKGLVAGQFDPLGRACAAFCVGEAVLGHS
ncbi:MAG: hypothetical protein RJA87_2236 [Pseudomonadota bacterium]|jgi:hypothetical protein